MVNLTSLLNSNDSHAATALSDRFGLEPSRHGELLPVLHDIRLLLNNNFRLAAAIPCDLAKYEATRSWKRTTYAQPNVARRSGNSRKAR